MPPGGAAVVRAQQRAVFARDEEGAAGSAGEAIEMIILVDDFPVHPGRAPVGGGGEKAICTNGEDVLRIDGHDVEDRVLEISPLPLFLPGESAIAGGQNEGVMADGPAARRSTGEAHARQCGGGGAGRAEPGVTLVGGAEDGAALAHDEGHTWLS